MLKTVGNPSTRYGDQTISDGNLVIGTSGKGIDFSADSHAAGMTSELLDDYEEGVWTPTVTATSGTITTYGAGGRYTKVGRIVVAQVYISISDVGTASGACLFTLPFTNGAFTVIGVGREDGLTGNMQQIRCEASFPYALFIKYENGSAFAGNGTILIGELTYTV